MMVKVPDDKTLVLVTNDDGVEARGIKALARAAKKLGSVVVVAPGMEQSATSHSLTLHRPLRVHKEGPLRYSVDGTPTDAVMLAIHGLLPRKPDILLSGVNRGPNLGDDVTYSGTVAAAIEGTLLGVPSIAVSFSSWERAKSYDPAAEFAVRLSRETLKRGLPKGVLLNVNVPPETTKGDAKYSITRLGKREYLDVIIEKTDPRGRPYYWIGGHEALSDDSPGTDYAAVSRGIVSITPLNVDLTHRATMKKLGEWRL
jgi:5'-nucleotidase